MRIGCLLIANAVRRASLTIQQIGIENCCLGGKDADAVVQTIFNTAYLANKDRPANAFIKVAIEFPQKYREFIPATVDLTVLKKIPEPLPFIFEDRQVETDGMSLINTLEFRYRVLRADLKLIRVEEYLDHQVSGGSLCYSLLSEVLERNFETFINTYNMYLLKNVSNVMVAPRFYISTAYELVRDLEILLPDQVTLVVDRLFAACHTAKQSIDRYLPRSGFLDFTIRLAAEVINTRDEHDSIPAATKELLEVHYKRLVKDVPSIDFIRKPTMLYSTYFNRVFFSYKSSLSAIFHKYQSTGTSTNNVLKKKSCYISDFISVCVDSKVVVLNDLNKRMLLKIFFDSKMLCLQENATRDKGNC
jgi:hypothetical protein